MATYPPEHHLLRDLRMTSWWVDDDECRFVAPLVPEVTTPGGEMAAGAIFAITDCAVCSAGLGASDEDWCGTLDLSIRSAAPINEGPLVVSCEIVRVGGRLITVRAELFDGRGEPERARLAGTALSTLRRMPRNPKYNTNPPEPKRVGVVQDWGGPTAGFATHLLDEIGCVEVGPGTVELIKSPYVTNSFGTVNGGTTGILVCAGAESAVGSGYVARDVEVRYVGQAGVGPVRTQCEVLRIDDRHAVVDVTVLDAGSGRSAIAVASVTLTPPDRVDA